ncbi:MAG: pyridoxamine 5'-phosphate oxidase [Tatlockia sp.]|nr:pyridoxamine 5'-phosphate oxidase [Tatlockia sp.]
MSDWKTMADIRREYGDLRLNEENLELCPLSQFKLWFEETSPEEISDPTAMTLSTVDVKGRPDSRVVLLKGLTEEGFIFFSNYESTKGIQLKSNPNAALNFYWPQMSRQVRVRGRVQRIAKEQSDIYFSSRPIPSQLSAIISSQSQVISARSDLDLALANLINKTGEQAIIRPQNWGGYQVKPEEVEFWQGRDNRLHDRILYTKKRGKWSYCRLAP